MIGDDQPEIAVDDARGILSYSRESDERLIAAYGQDQEVLDWAERNGYRVVGFFRDLAVHGETPVSERNGLSAAIGTVEDGRAAGIAVHRLDRLARDFQVQDDAMKRVWAVGGTLFSCQPNWEWKPDKPGDLQWHARRDLAREGKYELTAVLGRLQDGRRRKMERGGYGGGRRFARRYGVELVHLQGKSEYRPIPTEQAVIRRIVSLSAAGESYRTIAEMLNGEGVPTVTGAKWSHIVVRELVRRGPDRLIAIQPEITVPSPVEWIERKAASA